MKVCAFIPTGRFALSCQRGVQATLAMAHGAKEHGHEVHVVPQDEGYVPCDVAIMWGCGKKKFPETMIRDKIVAAHGKKPFLRMERGYLRREDYETVGLGQMWGYGYYNNEDSPPDRFKGLGLTIAPMEDRPQGDVLIIGQVPTDTSVQNFDFAKWVDWVKGRVKARKQSWRFRAHPDMGEPGRFLWEDLASARLVVTLTSTVAVDALLAGRPTIAMHPQSMAWRVCGTKLFHMHQPHKMEREQFFHDLAYAQWTHDEMREGKPWAHLISKS